MLFWDKFKAAAVKECKIYEINHRILVKVGAAAIVMDMGGMLSHGSIVAREYGIPAVVNVGPATKIIKTGQTIQVDANRGIVKIIR